MFFLRRFCGGNLRTGRAMGPGSWVEHLWRKTSSFQNAPCFGHDGSLAQPGPWAGERQLKSQVEMDCCLSASRLHRYQKSVVLQTSFEVGHTLTLSGHNFDFKQSHSWTKTLHFTTLSLIRSVRKPVSDAFQGPAASEPMWILSHRVLAWHRTQCVSACCGLKGAPL